MYSEEFIVLYYRASISVSSSGILFNEMKFRGKQEHWETLINLLNIKLFLFANLFILEKLLYYLYPLLYYKICNYYENNWKIFLHQ